MKCGSASKVGNKLEIQMCNVNKDQKHIVETFPAKEIKYAAKKINGNVVLKQGSSYLTLKKVERTRNAKLLYQTYQLEWKMMTVQKVSSHGNKGYDTAAEGWRLAYNDLVNMYLT